MFYKLKVPNVNMAVMILAKDSFITQDRNEHFEGG